MHKRQLLKITSDPFVPNELTESVVDLTGRCIYSNFNYDVIMHTIHWMQCRRVLPRPFWQSGQRLSWKLAYTPSKILCTVCRVYILKLL